MSISMPHERELVGLIDLVIELQDKPEDYLIIAVTDAHQHMQHLVSSLQGAVSWDQNKEFKLFRNGVKVHPGGTLKIVSWRDPGQFIGQSPNKLVLFGTLGEFFYHINAYQDCEIVGIA